MKEKRFKEFRAMSLIYQLLVIDGILDIIDSMLKYALAWLEHGIIK